MNDVDALIQAFVEEAIRRKKLEAVVAGLRSENTRLAGDVATLRKAAEASEVAAQKPSRDNSGD